MHACADKIIDLFSGKASTDSHSLSDESFMTNPAKLCYIIKQALREAAIGTNLEHQPIHIHYNLYIGF